MTVNKPTPTGKNAATTEPKTKGKIISESGPETASALIKSFFILSSNVASAT